MNIKEIANQYNIDTWEFEAYLKKIGAGKETLISYILEENIPEHVENFKQYLIQSRKEEAEKKAIQEQLDQVAKIMQEEQEKQKKIESVEKTKALAGMLITSGFQFDGYRIKKYSGYISGDDSVIIPRTIFGAGKVSQKLCDSLVKIRRQAIKELKEAAYDLGCNAVIGVDFDYLTMDPQHAGITAGHTVYEPYVICVTANGNAVVIEKE